MESLSLFFACLFFGKKKRISLTLFRSKRFQQKGTVIQYICNKILMLFIHFLEGRCIDGVNNYTCICDPGYVGRNCDRDFDDCSSSPCKHGEAVRQKMKVNRLTQNKPATTSSPLLTHGKSVKIKGMSTLEDHMPSKHIHCIKIARVVSLIG